jgi:hypothetical protein
VFAQAAVHLDPGSRLGAGGFLQGQGIPDSGAFPDPCAQGVTYSGSFCVSQRYFVVSFGHSGLLNYFDFPLS